MSKLWIVHRKAVRSGALARVIGLEPQSAAQGSVGGAQPADSPLATLAGSPTDDLFQTASAPAAILIAFEGDFELELDFLHRHRETLAFTRRRFIVADGDREEIRRLTGASDDELLDLRPDARTLRAFILSAVAHRNAESLTDRRDRERIAARFSSWFGDFEIPGLLRALDPSLASLPLLIRGVPGSGRALVARYLEFFRVHGAPGTPPGTPPTATLRLDARELEDAESIATRLTHRANQGRPPARTIWIDEIDALSPAAQRSIAEWIRIGAAPMGGAGDQASGAPLRWVATAGPGGLRDAIEPALADVMSPLALEIPALADHLEALSAFASQVLADWTAQVGGVPRSVSEAALEALSAHAFSGDRSSVESRLRAALAATSREVLEVDDLTDRFAPLLARSPLRSPEGLPTAEQGVRHENRASAATENLRQGFASAPVVPPASLLHADHEAGLEAAEFVESEAVEPAVVAPPFGFEAPLEKPISGIETTTDTIGDFKRAFLEGLPEVTNGDVQPSEENLPAANADVSTQMSAESFGAAATSVVSVDDAGSQSWRRLARSLSHEIRNPLVSIRTFTELLPENFDDESFRARFTELVGRDVAHIDEVVGRLAAAAAQEKIEFAAVDVSSLLERLLNDRRDEIGQRRLLVLRELEREAPIAWADAPSLEVALAGLLDRALASLPERGDLFVATRRIDRGPDGQPRLRVLLRHHNPEQSPALGGGDLSGVSDVSAAANVLEYVLAEAIVEACRGQLTIDTTDPHETLILVDLRTPA